MNKIKTILIAGIFFMTIDQIKAESKSIGEVCFETKTKKTAFKMVIDADSKMKIEKSSEFSNLFNNEKGSFSLKFRFLENLTASQEIKIYNLVKSKYMDFYIRQRHTGIEFYMVSSWYWGRLTFPYITNKWYRMDFVWDKKNSDISVFIDGLLQGRPSPDRHWRKPPIEDGNWLIGDKNIMIDKVIFRDHPLTSKNIENEFAKSGLTRYKGEGAQYDLGKFKFPSKTKLIYSNDFSGNQPLKDFIQDGKNTMSIVNDRLHVENTGNKQIVFWLNKIIPESYIVQWEIHPLTDDSTALIFLSTKGTDGKDIFSDKLKKRDGNAYGQYIQGDLRLYGISYFFQKRGTINLRRNPGFRLLKLAVDNFPIQKKYTFTLLKDKKRITLVRGDEIIMEYKLTDEDDKWTQPGNIGWRQMSFTKKMEYDNIKIWELKR